VFNEIPNTATFRSRQLQYTPNSLDSPVTEDQTLLLSDFFYDERSPNKSGPHLNPGQQLNTRTPGKSALFDPTTNTQSKKLISALSIGAILLALHNSKAHDAQKTSLGFAALAMVFLMLRNKHSSIGRL
jgi:hypothetical protein